MNKSNLINILSAFSASELENMIITKVRESFFSGDWGTANAIIEYILSDNSLKALHGKIANFGIFTAVRARDLQKALDRYEYLGKLDKTDANLCLLAEGLFHLSDLLLADQPSLLAGFLLRDIHADLPAPAQEKYAAVGIMLCKEFNRIGDMSQYEKIMRILESYITEPILHNAKLKLLRW